MIQNQTYPSLPWHGQRSRQRVLRSNAQHARYFLLGLAAVSLFVGLNVFLASQTAELEIHIGRAERQCQQLEFANAELAGALALATSIDEAVEYGRIEGFASAQQLVYLAPMSLEAALTEMAASGATLRSTSPQAAQSTPDQSAWEVLLVRFRQIVPALSSGERVASSR